MATAEIELISAVVRNKDPHTILGAHDELFGSTSDVIGFIREYYKSYRDTPTPEILKEKFRDIDLVENTGPSNYYLDRVRSNFIKDNAAFFMDSAQKDLEKGRSPVEVLEKVTGKFIEMGKFTGTSHDVNMKDLDSAVTHLEAEKLKAGELGVPGIATGFDAIDACYPTGMAGGNSIVLLGFSGKGKSMFSAKLGVNVWSEGYKVMIVSLEMTPDEYRNRLYPMMSEGRFSISEMGNASIDLNNMKRWGEEALRKSPDLIVVGMDGSGDMTPNRIQSKIEMYQPDLVILDYLQLMSDNRRTEGMTPRMLNLSREIKLMAMQNDIPIISITSVTDDENTKREHPPTLKQIAWSRGIEYDSSLVMAVHRYPETNYVHIVCRKNRIGDEFSFIIEVDFDRGIWTELFEMPELLKEKYA